VHTPRTPQWTRQWAAVAVAATLALGGAGCSDLNPAVGLSQSAGAKPAPASTGEAATELGHLTVVASTSMRGYSRARFPHWRSTGANCDVRDSVLKRDGTQVKLKGCNVVGGSWLSPYDKITVTDPIKMDVDHMVPLADAWRSGADKWDDTRRGDFANDLIRPQLRAVTASSNRAKGDQDPSQWKPTNRAFWCQYAQSWIAVKTYWKLTVTTAEKTALGDMLKTC
jgi:hypothetical protein